MPDSLTEELNGCVKRALDSDTLDDAMEHLAKGFTLFAKESERQKQQYEELEQAFQERSSELLEVQKRIQKIASEKEVLSSFLHETLKSMQQGLVFLSEMGMILSLNPKAEELLGLSAKDLLRKEYWNHLPDDFFGFSMRDALHFGLYQDTSYISIKPDRREMEVKTHFLKGKGILILLSDITKMQKYAQIAKRNNRLSELGQLTSTVAHEIKNPLGGIRGYAMLLERELKKNPQLKEMASHITEATKTLDRLLSKILSYAKPVEVQAESIDMALFLRKLIRFIKMDPDHPKNIEMEVHISKEPLYAPLDKDLFQQALLNIIVNAKHAISNGGKITLSLMKRENRCVLSVSDTGKGIEEKHLKEIFSPFFTTKEKGHGLGLTETIKIIEAHFGTIDVRSKKDRGTTFTLTLPLRR